jgi:hypothetical protein
MEFDESNGADDQYRRQFDHCNNTGTHGVSGLAIPAIPVRLNACDGLNVGTRFQAPADHENSKWDKGLYG